MLRIVRRWQGAQERRLAGGTSAGEDDADDDAAVAAAGGSAEDGEGAASGRRGRPAAGAQIRLPEGMPRIHRFEPLAAGQTNVVWCAVGTSKALAAEWAALCEDVLTRAREHCIQELARLQKAAAATTAASSGPSSASLDEHSSGSSSAPPTGAATAPAAPAPAAVAHLQSRLSRVYEQAARGGFVEIAGLSDTVAQLQLSAATGPAGVASGSATAGAGSGSASSDAEQDARAGGAGAVAVPPYPLTAQQEYALLVDALDKTATAASLPRGFRHLWRFLACVHRVRAIRLAGGGTGSTAAVARRRVVA